MKSKLVHARSICRKQTKRLNLTSGEKEKDFKTPYLQEIIYSQDNTQGFHEPNHITQKNLFFKIQTVITFAMGK